MASEEHTSESLLIQAREAEIIGSTGPGNEFHTREMRKVEAGLGPDFVTHGDIHESEIVVQGNDATLGTAAFLEAPSPKKVAFEDIHKASEDALHNKIQDQGQFGEEISIVHENIDLTSCIEVSEILQDEKSTELMELVQEINEVNADAALETVICDEEESREMITQVGNLKVHPYVTSQSEIGEIIEDRMERRLSEAEEIPLASQMGDFALLTDATLQATVEKERIPDVEETDKDQMLNLGQTRTALEEVGIEHDESHPRNDSESTEEIEDVISEHQNEVETKSESIEKVESIILNKELDGSENVLVTQNEHAIPKIFDKEKDGLILRQASHPSSEATLQPKLESSEISGEKNQISQEYWFENDQAPCVENLDDQGEPSSDECLRTKDAEMTLLVESSEAINVKCIAEEQQGVTDEAKAKDYDKPSNEFSEYIEQDDFDKQGQDFISVEETREGQTEEGKDFTEKESLLTETELKGMSRSTCISVQDKNANELHTAPPLVDQIGEHEVKQQEQDPRNEEVEEWELVSETNKEYNATEQENILETNVSEESIESEMGNITLISRYDNMDGTEKQRAIHDTDTSATKELNVTPKDGTQQTKFTEEIDEYIGGESPIHDNEQEDARGQMNSELSGVKDETSDNGDNENSAEEMQIDTDEEFTENNKVKGTLADCLTEKVAEGYQDDEKEDLMLSQEAAKAEQEDISVSSLAVKHETSGEGEYFDLSRVEDEATSIGNNENTAVDPNKKMTKDNTDDGLEVYELHEKTFDNLAALRQEVGIEDEYFSNNSLDVKDETGAEAENEHLMRLKGELGENEDNKFLTDIQEVNNISEGTISQDNAREEQKIQMEDVPQESLAEKIISQSENTVENVMQMKHTSDEFVEISGTSPESPAKELVVGHSDDREAKKFPEEIVENLSIVSKELEIEQSEQSIDSSIEKNETAAEGEDEELAEHQADDNVAKESAFEVKSENFQDDKAKEQISKPEDVSPELMEENIHPQNYTEESQVQTEDTSRQFTEDENVKGCLPEHSVSESHIQDAKETKEFHEEKYENRCIESLELEKEQECQIQDFSEDETRPGGSDETLKVQENLKDGNSIENYPKAGSIVSENENADEEKVQSEDSSKIFTEDDHVTSTGERVESNVNDSKVVEELSEEMSAKGDTEKLTAETSPKDGKIIEEPSYVEENIISAHNETVEEKMQVDDTNEQSPEESNLVDTPPESLAKEMAEASSGDGHEAKGRTSEQYEEESNLDTPSQSLEKKKAETSTDEGDIEKDVTEDIKTSAGENFPVEYADDEREPKDLSHDSSILNHATIAMEDNEAMEEEHKLLNEHITGEASLSAGHLIQHDDSIDAVNIQNEDAPEKCIEESTIPQDDKNEEQNAQIEDNNEELRKDEHATNISPGYPIQEVLQRTANDGKEEKEYNEKKCETFLTESTETESNNEVTKLNSSIPDDESANKNVEKLTADEDVQDEIIIYKAPSAITAGVIQDDTASSKGEEYLANSVSPDDEGIDQKALAKDKTRQETGTGKQIDKLADLDICEEHDQMQKEETPEQSDEIRATRDDEKLRVEASPKDEKIIEETSPVAENVISQNDETKEEMQMEGTNEKNPEESNLVDTPFEPQEEKTTETSTDDEHEAKESTEEVTITAGEKFSIEHAEVVREPKELDHDSSISNHATITTEDNEGEIVEQKLEDQQTPREAYISERTAIHQDDSSYAVKIQKEAAPEKSIAETATSITPEYPIEEALQRTTNDGEEENKDSEQKCESPLLESNEVEEACEGAKLKSSVPNNETANESVELTEAENVKDENVSDKASSAITDEVIQDNISLFKGKEFPADSLSVADEDIDQKAVLKDKTEQSTYTGTEIDELANLDESDKYNDQMGKEGTPEKFEEMTEDYKMETTQEELTKEYNTGISVESPDEKIVNISADNGEKESELNEEISENGNDQKLTAELLPDDEKRIEEASLAKETAETSTENDHKSTEGTSEQYKEENYRVDTPSESLEAKETETSTDDGHEANDITEEVTTMGKSISIEDEVVKEPEDLDHDSLASRSATTTIEDNEGVTVEQKHKDEQAMGEAYLSAGNTILHDNNIDVVKIQNEDAPEKRMEESTTLQNDKNEEHNAHIEDKIEELTIKEHATSISPEYPIEEVLQSTTNDEEEEKEGSEQKLESFLTESTEIETSNENVKKFIAENVRDESIIDEASSAITDEVDQNDVALCKGEEFLAASASPDDEGIYQKVLPNDKTEQATDTGKEIHELVDLDKSEKLNDEMQKETSEQSVNMTEEYRMETTHIQLTREYSTGTSAESPDEKIVVDADNVKKETDFNEESNVNQINQSVEHTAVGADHEDLGFQISDPENAASTKGEKEELMEKSPDQENIIEDTSPSAGYSIPCDDQKLIAEASPEDEKRILEASHAKETTETSTENEHASVDGTGEQLNVENYHVDTPSESSEAKETETSTDDGHEAKEMREEVTTEASPDDEKEIVEASLAKEMAETSTENGPESMESTSEALPDDLKRIEEASLAKETAETSTENDHESMECTSEQCKEEDYHVDTPSESLEAKETERSTDDGHEAKDLCYQTSDPENATNTKGENEELTKKRTDHENIIEDTSTSAVHSIPCDDQNLLAEASPEDEKRLVEASLAKETAETSTENGHESIDGTSEPPTAENYHVDTPSESSEAKETEKSIDDGREAKEIREEITKEASPEDEKEIVEASLAKEMAETSTENGQESMESTSKALPDDEKRIDEASLAKETAETSTENDHESTEGTSEQYKEENYHVDTPSESLEGKESETSTGDGHEANDITEEVTTMGQSISIEDEVVKEPEDLDHDSLASRSATTTIEDNEGVTVEQKQKDEQAMGEASFSAGNTIRHDNNIDVVKIQKEDAPEKSMEESTTLQNDKTEEQNAQIEDKSEELTINERETSILPEYPIEEVLQSTKNDGEEEKEGSEQKHKRTSEQNNVENYHVDTPSEYSEAKETETSTDDGHEAKEIREEVTTEASPEDEKEIEEASPEDEKEIEEASLGKETAETSTEYGQESMESTSEALPDDEERIVVDADNIKKETYLNEESNENQINQSVEHTAVVAEHEDRAFQTSHPEIARSSKEENEELTEKSPDQENIIEDASPSVGYSISRDDQKLLAEESPEDEKKVAEASLAKETAETSTDNGHESTDGTSEQYNVENYNVDTPSESSEAKEAETSTEGGHEAKEIKEEVTTEASPEDEKEIAEASLAKETAETSTEYGQESMESTSEELPDDEERIIVDADNIKKETDLNEENNENQINQSVEHTAVGAKHEDLAFQTSDPENATSTKGENEELTEKSPDQESIIEDASPSVGYSIPRDDQKLLAEESPEDEKKIAEASLAKETAETSTENGHESTDGTSEQYNVENYHLDTPSESSEAKEAETSTEGRHEAKEIKEEVTTEASPEDEREIAEACLAKETAETSTENGYEPMEGTSEASPEDETRRVEASLEKETAETSTENDHESTEGTSEQYKEENYHVDTPSESLEVKKIETSTDDGHEGKDITEEVITMGQSISIEDEVVKEPEDLDHDSLATRTEDAPEKSIEESATLQNDKNEEKNAQIEDKGEELTLNEHATNISPEYPIEEVLQWTTNDGEEEKDSEQKLESFLTENTEIERNPKGAKLESSIPINETSNENVKNFTAENVSDENKIDEASSAITAELDQDEAAVCKDEESVAVCLSPDDEGIDQKALPNDKTEQATDTGKEIDDLTDLDKSEKHDDKMQKETSGHSGEMTEEYGMETTHEDLTREYNTGTSTEFLDEKIINDADYVKKKNELNEKSDENQSVERAAVGADHEDLGFQTSDPGNATSTKGENEELTEKSPDKEKITEDISLSAGYSVPRDDRIEERKVKIEDVTHESVEGNTVSQHDDTEQDYMEKDQISQQIEGSHATVTSAEIPVKISNESSTVDENKTNASITEERKNLGTQENNETLTAQNDAQEEIIQVSSAITAEQMPDNASIYNTEQFLSTDSSEGKGIEQTSEHNMAEDKSEQTADVLSKMGQTATTNQIEEQNHQIQREEITEQLIEETDIVTINDQTREPTENEVSEENFGKANADERNTEQNKEIVSIPETEGSEKEIVLETTAAHVEASSTASDVDCIFEEHEESLSLGQNVDSGIQVSGIYTTEQAADEGHAVPDEVPDARERNYYNDEVTIEPIKEVEGGTTEATETVNEGLVADALEKSDTEMQMESEGQAEADFIKKFHEDDQVNIPSQLTTDSKFSGPEEVKITEEGNSRALEGDDTMIYESRKDNLEDEENQDDFARVQESALQTETVTVISEKDGPVTKFNGSIQEVENSASAEMVEQKQQYEASNPKTDNFLGEENHNSDSLVEKHEMAIGTEKENEKLSEHPSDSNKEDTAEKRSQNDEDALKEEAESSLEVEGLINKAEDENKVTEESALIEQVLLEPEGKDGVKFSIQTSENRSDATDLQQDQMKTVMISPESGQEEGEDAVYSDSTSETQSSNITKTPCNEQEASPRAETLDECTLLEEKGEHPDKTTIRENELSEERINENLESDDLVKKIEHDTTSGNEEANKNLTEHPFVSTIKDVTEERQQNDEVIQTDERETTIADQVPVEHEDEMKEKGIHKTAENQIDTTYLQLEETKTVTSTESSQKGEQKVIDLNSITEADSSEPSTVEKTENECHFPEERCQSSINSTKKEDEPSEERTIKENLISDTVVKKHENEIASSETNKKPSSYPSDLTKEDIIEERLRNNDAAPTEEVASNLNTNSTVNREASENEVTENLIITDQVLTGPANVDNVRSIQETTENQIDDNHLEHDEIKQKAIDATNITENESSDITETPYKQPEALAVEKTAEECGLEEERGLSSQNNTEGNNEPSKKIINEVSMDPEDENKVLSIQEAADNQNDANELLHKEIKTGVSFESVTNGKEMATDSNYIPETEISDKMETPYNNSDASIIVRTLEECGVPEGTGQSPENYSIREQQQSQINKEEVVMEPEDEDEAKIIQELLERRNDITDLQHDEMQAVTSSESVQNENAMNFDKTTETENLDKMDMLCNESKISNVVNTLEECDLSEERNKVETVEAERSLKQTHWEEEITCFKTSSSQKSEQTVDNFEIIGNEEGGRTDLNDIQTTDYHLPVTCKRKGNDDVEVELPAEGVAKQIKVVPTEAHKVMEEGFIQIKENPVIERMVSNSIEEETTCVSPSYNNWKHFEEIIKNEMEADEPPPPNEEDEPLQGVSFEEHSASTEGMGKIEADLKSMSNETEEQQFSELVLYEQKHKGSLLTEEIAEENMERVQQLEEKNTGYSSPEQVKDKNLHEEVPREPDVQNLDFDTSKSLQQKEDVAQEASKTDPEIIMQPRDFSSQIQYTVFSTESEKTTEIDTFIHSYLQETKDVEKVQATGIPDGKLENLYKETTDVDSQLTGSLEQIHEPHDELNISEETTNTCEKHMAKNSDTTTEELSTEEGSKLCNVIVNEVPYDQTGKGHEVIAKTNQVEEDKGDAKKCHQVAREYSQEERGIDDVLLRSEKNLMETVERKSSTREHKGKDNLQVVSTEDLSASQQTEKPQEVSISEETTNTYEKHKAKNSDITIEELSTDEGSKLRNVIVNEGPYDQIGKGDEVVAKTNQVEEDKGDTKKYHQLAREYTQEERGIDDVLLRSEKNFMETLERESSTREHKAEDYWQVVSAEDVSASQQTEKAQEVLIEGLAHHGEIEEKQYQMQAYSIKIEETGKTEIKEEDVIRRAIPEEKEEECEEAGLIAATITEGSKEMDVKAHHKKSHNLLSGVGSRVKQSISKVKKAITGKPSQPKNPSPKKATAKGE